MKLLSGQAQIIITVIQHCSSSTFIPYICFSENICAMILFCTQRV